MRFRNCDQLHRHGYDQGRPLSDALKLTNQAVVEALDGLPAVKIHCSVLAEQAIKAAIADYYSRQGIDPEPIVGQAGGSGGARSLPH